MTSKAQRKRRKKAAQITMPGGESLPQRVEGAGRPRKTAEEPRKTVADARMRRTGIKDSNDACQPICGTDLGLCIQALSTGDEFRALSEAWAAISASHRNYRMLYIGQTGHPKGAAIAMVPEPLETDQALTIDIRTADERIRAAKASWGAWQGMIDALPAPPMKWAIEGALNGFLGDGALWRDAAPTTTGKTAVTALRVLMSVHKAAAAS